jgi:hypothetical protein
MESKSRHGKVVPAFPRRFADDPHENPAGQLLAIGKLFRNLANRDLTALPFLPTRIPNPAEFGLIAVQRLAGAMPLKVNFCKPAVV